MNYVWLLWSAAVFWIAVGFAMAYGLDSALMFVLFCVLLGCTAAAIDGLLWPTTEEQRP